MADLFGAGITAATGIINNIMARSAAKEARRDNYMLNEKAANQADKRQRALLEEYYTPRATIKQLEEAGLSPALMYGSGGGTSGTNMAQGAGAEGIGTMYSPINASEMAQIELINAQKEKTKAETETIQGKNERGQAEIAEKLAEAGYKRSAEALNQSQEALNDIEITIKGTTTNAQIENIIAKTEQAKQDAKRAFYEAKLKGLEQSFNEETYDIRVQTVSKKYAQLIADIAEKYAHKNLMKEQAQQLIEQVQQGWKELEIKDAGQKAQQKYWEDTVKNEIARTVIKEKEYQLEQFKVIFKVLTDLLQTLNIYIKLAATFAQ